jgi:low affinity Fe/Cu permease
MAARFDAFARLSSRTAGRPGSFVLAVLIVVVWLVTGPLFHWSDTWQLVINTGTTIVTFLMVFLIQATQNRDTAAIQVKLDELIRSSTAAHNAMLDLEELDEKELERIRRAYQKLATKARSALRGTLESEAQPEDALLRAPKG